MLTLVLESSTTSAKAMLFSSKTGVLEMKTRAYPAEFINDGEQDAEGIFSLTMELGRQVANNQNVEMIALCGTWHNLLICDKQMKPVTPAYSWTYTRAAGIARELRRDSEFTHSFYEKTGCMVHAIYPVFKLMQLKGQGLETDNCLISSQGSYTFYQLTQERLASDCMASGSGFLNIKKKQLDEDILKLVGLHHDQIGRIVTYRDTRPLTEKGAELLGIKSGIPVIPANSDGGLNQVAAGGPRNGVMTFSVGTSGALRLSTPEPVLPEEPNTWCYLSPYSWMSGAATSGACNCVDWVKTLMFPANTTYAEIESQNVQMEILPIFLPFLYGERCPGWNDDRSAGFHNVLASHSSVDMYFSVMEGTLLNLYQCYENICATNKKPTHIQLSGGILNSGVWRQMCCDIFGLEMQCPAFEHTSLLGGAFLALDLLGITDSTVKDATLKGDIIYPNEAMREHYMARYRKYMDCYGMKFDR